MFNAYCYIDVDSQKNLQEPGLGLQEGFQEPRIGESPHFQEQKIDSLAPFPGQSSGKTLPFPGHFISGLPQLNIGVLGLLPELSIGAVEPFLDQSNSSLEFFPRQAQAINSQAEFLKEQVMYRLDQLRKQINGPSSQLQEQNQVIQRKSWNPKGLWFTAKSRGIMYSHFQKKKKHSSSNRVISNIKFNPDVGSQKIMQVERNGLPTQKMPPRYPRGSFLWHQSNLIIQNYEPLTAIPILTQVYKWIWSSN